MSENYSEVQNFWDEFNKEYYEWEQSRPRPDKESTLVGMRKYSSRQGEDSTVVGMRNFVEKQIRKFYIRTFSKTF